MRDDHASPDPRQESAEESRASESLGARRRESKRAFLRCVIWVHIVAVGSCALLSYFDMHGMYSGFPGIISPILGAIGLPALFLCPAFAYGAIWTARLSGGERFLAMLTETLLLVAHFMALLPGVQ